jgi:Flp pilus assembly pilin Flp
MAHPLVQATERQKGQGLAEYAMILALIALACIVALGFFGSNLSSYLQMIGSSI